MVITGAVFLVISATTFCAIEIVCATITTSVNTYFIYRGARIVLSRRENSDDALLQTWRNNVAAVRAGGEAVASDAVVADQFLPSLMVAVEYTTKEIEAEAAAHGISPTAIATLRTTITRAVNVELTEQRENSFTHRMSYMAMDDFLVTLRLTWRTWFLGSADIGQPRHAIDLLSLSGGGAKGVAYIALLQVLQMAEFRDVLSNDCIVSGASAGAAAAVMAAFSVEAENLQQWTREIQDGGTTLFERSDLRIAYGVFHKTLSRGLFSGLGIVNAIDRMLHGQVVKFLNRLPEDAFATLSPEERARVGQLLRPFDDTKDRWPHMVRFGDIAILLKLGCDVRQLHIALWNNDLQATVVANHETTPDVPIACAVRMSATVPLVFRSSLTDMIEGTCYRYYDGGMESQAPTRRILGLAAGTGAKKTLAVMFDNNGATIHEDRSKRDMLLNSTAARFYMHIFGTNPKDLEAKRELVYDEIESYKPLIMPHGCVKTTDFFVSEAVSKAVVHQGRLAAIRHIMGMLQPN
jgi:predicted acylesterase/phospholipase RssA